MNYEENQAIQPKNTATDVLSCLTNANFKPYMYLGLAGLLLLNMILVLCPFLEVSVFGMSTSFTLSDMGSAVWITILTILLNLLAIAVLAIPFMKNWLLQLREKMSESVAKYLDMVLNFFEKRLNLVIPAGGAAALEVLMFVYVLIAKNDALDSLGGGMMGGFSISVGFTFAGWLMLLCSLGAVAIAALMILEILGKKVF